MTDPNAATLRAVPPGTFQRAGGAEGEMATRKRVPKAKTKTKVPVRKPATKAQVPAEPDPFVTSLVYLGTRLNELGFNAVGFLSETVAAEERYQTRLAPGERTTPTSVAQFLREDLSGIKAPSVVHEMFFLRHLLEQGGLHRDDPPSPEFVPYYTSEACARGLEEIARAITLQPPKKGGRPVPVAALRKRWRGMKKLVAALEELLQKAAFSLRQNITPAERLERTEEIRRDIARIPELVRWPVGHAEWAVFKVAGQLAAEGYAVQHARQTAKDWALSLRLGYIGFPVRPEDVKRRTRAMRDSD